VKTCVVFGAASGIGEGIAARFLRDGARVVAADDWTPADDRTQEG
jgi:NAD(P)-dependent dehydrogenase (short-subunit alcohol dehydrogenase family)